jgi:hypothetical protein
VRSLRAWSKGALNKRLSSLLKHFCVFAWLTSQAKQDKTSPLALPYCQSAIIKVKDNGRSP